MREIIDISTQSEVLSLVTGVTYSHVPSWYGSTFRDLKMDMIIPKHREGHKKCPAVLWLCGGAYMVVDRSVWMPEMIRLARAGYIVASAEYRTSNGDAFPAQLIDVKTAVRFLKAHAEEYCIDPDRIFAMGESAGGGLASLLGTTAHHAQFESGDYREFASGVRGVVSFYGPSIADETAKVESGGDVPDWTMKAYLGSNYSFEDVRASSAATYIDENTVPFLLLQGTKDPYVPMAMADKFYESLQAHGIETDLLVFEGAGHGEDVFYQDIVFDRIIDFLNKHSVN